MQVGTGDELSSWGQKFEDVSHCWLATERGVQGWLKEVAAGWMRGGCCGGPAEWRRILENDFSTEDVSRWWERQVVADLREGGCCVGLIEWQGALAVG